MSQAVWLWVGSFFFAIFLGYIAGKLTRFIVTAVLLALLAYALCLKLGYPIPKSMQIPAIPKTIKLPADWNALFKF